MREILFRAKTLSHGWKTGFIGYTKDPLATQIFWTEYDGIQPVTKKDYVFQETIGQYTGLTDKNGVKIFEGDVAKDSFGWIFEVVWDSENARFLGRHDKPRGDTYICYVGRIPAVEVIGNIFNEEGKTE